MKRIWCFGVCLFLASCSILSLPFQLLGAVISGISSLFKMILGLGSAAATQAVKLSPYALLFTSSDPSADPANNVCLETVVQSLETASLETMPADEAMVLSCHAPGDVVVLAPVSLLENKGKEELLEKLRGKKILEARWVTLDSLPLSQEPWAALPSSPSNP